MPYICGIPDESMSNAYVDNGRGHYLGECVSLLKKMCPSLPATATWTKGDLVKGATIKEGTAIASFNPLTSHYWHAAIYVRQDASGIWVWDQYCRGVTAHPPKLNLLRWVNAGHPHVAGNNFYVIS